MFRQLKLTCRGMFHCTFSNNWQSLQHSLIMAQEQKSTRRKEQKASKNTSCPRRRELLVYQRVINNSAAQFPSSVRYDILSFHDTRRCFPSARVRRRELLFL